LGLLKCNRKNNRGGGLGKIKSDGGCFWNWILIRADWILKGGGGLSTGFNTLTDRLKYRIKKKYHGVI
jgi:hypothetical protein